MADNSSTEFNKELIEKLAEAAHELFCDDLKRKGYTYGPVTQKGKKVHSSLRPYAELPEDEKEQNRSNVRDIPYKLAQAGYTVAPACGEEGVVRLSEAEIEKLAKREHERWMRKKLDWGWEYAKVTDKTKKLHKDLVPWEELPLDEREKDIVFIRNIPRILEKAGYIAVKSGMGHIGVEKHGA
jgi:hypothetical protein